MQVPDDMYGINDREQLAFAEGGMRQRIERRINAGWGHDH